MKHYIKRISAALIMCGILYGINFSASLPDRVTFISGRPHSMTLARGVKISNLPRSVKASADTVVLYDEGEYEARLSMLGGIVGKKISVKVVPQKNLTAVGELVGIKLLGRGVIVIGFADFYPGGDLKQGDIITGANGEQIESYKDFERIATSDEEISLEVYRDDSTINLNVVPVECEDGVKRLGIWVRDSAAGVGTMTFVDKEMGVYGALGHGISDSDTGVRFPVRKGTVEHSIVSFVTKGRRGAPGEITGAFVPDSRIIGTVEMNTDCGIFGHTIEEGINGEPFTVALSGEIKVGQAEIICDVGEGRSHYSVNIIRINRLGNVSKGILLEITDQRLLALTGGIVQGMSGSPIIQNGAIVGAVTHVLVNDPACGYGVFIENMLEYADAV